MQLVRMKGALKQVLINGGRFYMNNQQSYTGILSTWSTSQGYSVYEVKFETPTTASAPFVLQPRVVVYDGVCHLCNRGVQWVIKADKNKKIRFCAVQSKAAEPYLIACGLDQKDVLRRFLFVEGPGLCHQASTAALKILSYLPVPYSILSSFLIIPTPLRDAVYDYVAKHRYDWFGKSVECIVPDNEVFDRFIDRDEMLERQKKI
ncbi:uncharacterized protein LOC131064147 isoform X1 [Cryptomeria japonica]|uniref:uncharacterized protein LOC131064147 isoform X1 n=2 Tax=Cryptomeria japonica TaxID=3369 RepID=UPI0027DA132D|nr:uncharacterized protein LOC131064147 isoform X1 [Cryptomeria japonica]